MKALNMWWLTQEIVAADENATAIAVEVTFNDDQRSIHPSKAFDENNFSIQPVGAVGHAFYFSAAVRIGASPFGPCGTPLKDMGAALMKHKYLGI